MTWPSMIAFGSRIRRITAIIETVLPEPDSPTIPSTSPRAIEKERPSTAWTTPSSVRNETRRSRTSRSGAGPLSGCVGPSCVVSGMAHPRVEQGVDEVDDGVRQHDEEGRVHDRGHDHRQVEV